MIHLGNKLFGVLTAIFYYEGNLVEYGREILPDNEGILLTENGIYSGSFDKGKAAGKGVFRDIEQNTTYKGIWKDGTLVEGTI